MKIAIIQDELVRKGGAEQVVLSFLNAFPEAPVYTLSYNPDTTFPEFKSHTIRTTWFGKLFKKDKTLKRFFFPFGIWAMKQLHVKGYDVILQSATHCSKYIKTDPGALVITYCHTPFRLVWNPESYKEVAESSFLKKKLYDIVIAIIKKIDKESARRTDWFITNASGVVPRIKSAYAPQNPISIIHPSVKCDNFYVSDTPKDFYLVVSRFEPYKKIELVIDAFNLLPDKKLVVIGKGSLEDKLKAKAGHNITFLNGVDNAKLAEYLSNCKALIFPQLEDYGITPLEANASGRPVIAFGKGGVNDTMIPVSGKTNSTEATAIFFNEQTIESLISAIDQFEQLTFDPQFIREHAEAFGDDHFVRKIREFVFEKYRAHAVKPEFKPEFNILQKV